MRDDAGRGADACGDGVYLLLVAAVAITPSPLALAAALGWRVLVCAAPARVCVARALGDGTLAAVAAAVVSALGRPTP